jgi:Fic family protein
MTAQLAKWIWQATGWPRLVYSYADLGAAVSQARLEQGRLIGKAETVGAGDLSLAERDLWSDEALATAAIEGEVLNVDAVRSSVARRLGIISSFVAAVPRNIEVLLDVMEDAAANWNSDLTQERICRWQGALFPAGVSSLRTIQTGRYRSNPEPMQIVSGPLGKETVHYEAPPSSAMRAEMDRFLDWFNRSRTPMAGEYIDGIVRAGLTHVWFESIHPFEDGNGRVGRAIVDMALAQDASRSYRLHGLSAELRRRQQHYYEALNQAQRGDGDVTSWLLWFLDAFRVSCLSSATIIDEAIERARFWAQHKDVALNERQRKALNKMLEAGPGRFEGGMTPRKYHSLTGTTGITATRDLTALADRGLLVRHGAGRSTYYDLAIPGWGWSRDHPKKETGSPISFPNITGEG